MRTTVTLEKGMIDKLVGETKAKSKASAVQEAVSDYLRRKKISKIKSLKRTPAPFSRWMSTSRRFRK